MHQHPPLAFPSHDRTEIDFSTNLTATYSGEGKLTVTASGGGSGSTVETPTGDVDASNTTFTPTSEPSWVVADGITYFDGAGYSFSGGDIEMDLAPSDYIRAII